MKERGKKLGVAALLAAIGTGVLCVAETSSGWTNPHELQQGPSAALAAAATGAGAVAPSVSDESRTARPPPPASNPPGTAGPDNRREPDTRPAVSVVGIAPGALSEYAAALVEEQLQGRYGIVPEHLEATLYLDDLQVHQRPPDRIAQFATKVARASLRLVIRNAMPGTAQNLAGAGASEVFFAEQAPPDDELKRSALLNAIRKAFAQSDPQGPA